MFHTKQRKHGFATFDKFDSSGIQITQDEAHQPDLRYDTRLLLHSMRRTFQIRSFAFGFAFEAESALHFLHSLFSGHLTHKLRFITK